MNKIFIALFCLVAVHVNARQVITGGLTDKETTKPIDGASVELLQLPDSSVVELVKSSSQGLFMFSKADTAKLYCLKVRHLAYKTTFIPVSKKKSMINNIGMISIDPRTFNFKEIVINGSKVRITELGDRTVYGISDGIRKSSTDGLDVMRKVPSVQVDYLNENITVNGKTNVKIEVDGVTRDKEYLKRLHPSQFDKMEVITSPSGKYDADLDAVINIVTNPTMKYGLKGTVNAMVLPVSSDKFMTRGSASLDYGLEKVSYYVAATGMTQNFDIVSDMNRLSGVNQLMRDNDLLFKNNNINLNAGVIYDPNEFNNLNLNVAYNGNSTKNNSDIWNYNSSNGLLNSISNTLSNSKIINNGLTSSLFFKHKFDKKGKHGYEMELKYYNSLNNSSANDFRNSIFSPTDTSLLSLGAWLNEKSKTKTQTLTGQANYTLPFDSVFSFNGGLSGNLNKYAIDNKSSFSSAPNLEYSDLRLGAYAELSRSFKKGSVKLGSRFETSHVVINSSPGSDYFSILPYANASHKFDDNNSLKFSYSKKVIRPGVGQLNPFVSQVDSQTISMGNPGLKPAYRDYFQFTYNKKVTVKAVTVNVAPQLFYEAKTGLIQNIISQKANTDLFESMPFNISDGYEVGAALSLNSQIDKVMLNSNFRYSFNHINQYQDKINETNNRSWNWNTFLMAPLPLNLKFITMFNINGPMLDGQTETQMSPFYFFGLIKQFKNNSTLSFLSFNPFSSKFFNSEATLRSSSIYQRTTTYMNSQVAFAVGYSYNFKIGKSVDKQKRTIEQQVEEGVFKMPSF